MVDAAEPVVLAAADAGRVVAAIGMVLKLTVEALQNQAGQVEAVEVATDAADAVVGLGAAIRAAGPRAAVTVSGSTAVHARTVLRRVIDLIAERTWTCPCRGQHLAYTTCDLERNLTNDLALLGGLNS